MCNKNNHEYSKKKCSCGEAYKPSCVLQLALDKLIELAIDAGLPANNGL